MAKKLLPTWTNLKTGVIHSFTQRLVVFLCSLLYTSPCISARIHTHSLTSSGGRTWSWFLSWTSLLNSFLSWRCVASSVVLKIKEIYLIFWEKTVATICWIKTKLVIIFLVINFNHYIGKWSVTIAWNGKIHPDLRPVMAWLQYCSFETEKQNRLTEGSLPTPAFCKVVQIYHCGTNVTTL